MFEDQAQLPAWIVEGQAREQQEYEEMRREEWEEEVCVGVGQCGDPVSKFLSKQTVKDAR